MRSPIALLAALSFSVACSSSDSTGGTGSPPVSTDGTGDGGTSAATPPTGPTPTTASPKIPKSTGTCPAIASGEVTFAPAGVPPRKVTLALDPSAASEKAELLFYWHATGSAPVEAAYALGSTQAAFTKAGGIVVAPHADPTAGQFEWFIVNQSPKLDDFLLADEIVACLVEAKRVDPTKIHSMGMSAGGLQTTALSFLRSSYIASVATYSGGLPDGFQPMVESAENKFAALIFDGGPTDTVFGVDFTAASARYATLLDAAGHFTARCNHGTGHAIPFDAAPSVVAFFAANPFGAWPSPFVSTGLPAAFPAYCKR